MLTDRPPPIIRQGPSNQTLGVDSVALLKCQASGDPVPSISWLKDGASLLGKDPRMTLQELGSLQIRGLRVINYTPTHPHPDTYTHITDRFNKHHTTHTSDRVDTIHITTHVYDWVT